MRKIISAILIIGLLSSCSEVKKFEIDGKSVEVEKYGWANKEAAYNENILYEIDACNLFLSVIFCETLVVPVLLTGYSFYEPVKVKEIKNINDEKYRFNNCNFCIRFFY